MRRCFVWTVFAAVLGVSTAWSQIPVFDVPFAFHVGDQHLKAGTYKLIIGQPFEGMLTLVSPADGQRVSAKMFLDHPTASSEISPALRFRRYGPDEYFLNQVCDPDDTAVLKLPESKHELVTSQLVAARAPELVLLAASQLR